ncbi:MAG: TfoX/Sxy family DNA transformation protein [Planctomycetaceae bacterium]|nr:TfoX/Sxy family DNA transformation protein [Planctomycetaceae bacterium]
MQRRLAPASMNLLWALAAGLENRDWKSLTAEEKQRLSSSL